MSEREIEQMREFTKEEALYSLADEFNCTSNDIVNEMWLLGIDIDNCDTYDYDRLRRYMNEK